MYLSNTGFLLKISRESPDWHIKMKVNELIFGPSMDLVYFQESLFSCRCTSLSYFSILLVPFCELLSSLLFATHLQKISQGSSLTPGLLAPLSSSPVHSTKRYLAQVGSRSSARSTRSATEPLPASPNNEFRTYNWMCRCYGQCS